MIIQSIDRIECRIFKRCGGLHIKRIVFGVPFSVLGFVDEAGELFAIVEEGEQPPDEQHDEPGSDQGAHQTEADGLDGQRLRARLLLGHTHPRLSVLTETVDEAHLTVVHVHVETFPFRCLFHDDVFVTGDGVRAQTIAVARYFR